MLSLINDRVTYVWLLLAVLTAGSWALGDSYEPNSAQQVMYLSLGLLALAFIKIRLVIMHFMEVADAPVVLRVMFETWVIVVFCILVGLYLTVGPV